MLNRRLMYLRPGNLLKDFAVATKSSERVNGRMVDTYVKSAVMLSGTLTVATQTQVEQTKNRWDQEQHSLTHTIVGDGPALAKKGDRLIRDGSERIFEVLAVDDVGELGVKTIYYTEERNDVK